MSRIVRQLHRAQLLATVAVIVAAAVAFALLGVIGGSQQSHIETDELLDGIQAQIVQLGGIHSAITTTNTVNDAALTTFAVTRAQINTDLDELRGRTDNQVIYDDLDAAIQNYLTSLDTLVGAAQKGTLATNGDLLKSQSARAVFEVGVSIREARAELSAESTSAWRKTRLGFIGVIAFLVVSVLVITRMTERRLRQALLDRERDRLDRERQLQFAALVENISDAIVVLDRSGYITYASPATAHVLGHNPTSLYRRKWTDLLHREDRRTAESAIQSITANETARTSETLIARVQRDTNESTWVEATATNHQDIYGINGIVINARDITERRRTEDSLRYRAFHDPLTGLANRTVLTEHIEKALQQQEEADVTFAVMFIDLDDFKYINDTWGHACGDDLLVTISARLRSILRSGDLAARLGGDEFVLVVNNLSCEDAANSIADRVHNVLANPFQIGNSRIHISASLGIALAGRTSDETVDDILRDADIAMYRAKREGRNRTHVYAAKGETGRLIPMSA